MRTQLFPLYDLYDILRGSEKVQDQRWGGDKGSGEGEGGTVTKQTAGPEK